MARGAEPRKAFPRGRTAYGHAHGIIAGQRFQTAHTMMGLDADAVAAGMLQKTVDDGVGVLGLRKHTVVVLPRQRHTVPLKPGIGVLMVKMVEEPFQQAVTAGVYTAQVGNSLKGVGAVAAAAAGYLNLGQNSRAAFQDTYFCLRTEFLQVDGAEKTCRATAYHCHSFLRFHRLFALWLFALSTKVQIFIPFGPK